MINLKSVHVLIIDETLRDGVIQEGGVENHTIPRYIEYVLCNQHIIWNGTTMCCNTDTIHVLADALKAQTEPFEFLQGPVGRPGWTIERYYNA